jgi:hypothetical protein
MFSSASAPTTQFVIDPQYLRAATNTAGCASPYYAYQYTNSYQCTSLTTSSAGCQCFSSDFVTVDPGNTDGTVGMCFVGPASFSELRLLTVRPKSNGAIYGWPSGITATSLDQTCTSSSSFTPFYLRYKLSNHS